LSDGYRCNGLSSDPWGIIGCESDRVSQTVDGVTTDYALDTASSLTQVLSDGTNTYLYGNERIAQYSETGPGYFLADGLGSMRQMVDGSSAVILAKSYQPYGEGLSHRGTGDSSYGFAGEMIDPTGLVYLRARYYSSKTGRFITRDSWLGDYHKPMSYNAWLYGYGNPINRKDPTGLCAENGDEACWGIYEQIVILCPECSLMVRATGLGDLQLHQENIRYLQIVFDRVSAGWRPHFSVDHDVNIRKEATNFGVPWQVVAGVIESEIELDTQWWDYLETDLYRLVPWVANYRSDPGPGIGNIHISTARNVAAYFSEYSCPSMRLYIFPDESKYSITSKLTLDAFSIRVVSATVKQLADYRFGSNGQANTTTHADLSLWTIADGVAVWHGYRYGVPDVSVGAQGFKDLEDFQNRTYTLDELVKIVVRGPGAQESASASIPIFEKYFLQR
jgi:RHS repeat-associated protein